MNFDLFYQQHVSFLLFICSELLLFLFNTCSSLFVAVTDCGPLGIDCESLQLVLFTVPFCVRVFTGESGLAIELPKPLEGVVGEVGESPPDFDARWLMTELTKRPWEGPLRDGDEGDDEPPLVKLLEESFL